MKKDDIVEGNRCRCYKKHGVCRIFMMDAKGNCDKSRTACLVFASGQGVRWDVDFSRHPGVGYGRRVAFDAMDEGDKAFAKEVLGKPGFKKQGAAT
jgi:hypothetical protein